MLEDKGLRENERLVDIDPKENDDARLSFIGQLKSNWAKGNCPKNLTKARDIGQSNAVVIIDAPYREGLTGLEIGMKIWLLLWFDRARRDIIIQAPKDTTEEKGVFALRSPVRPNPISIQAVSITDIDLTSGRVEVDATDAFDGTPILDIKPWIQKNDVPPDC